MKLAAQFYSMAAMNQGWYAMAKKKTTQRNVVVTTDKDRRGVFFGTLVKHSIASGTAIIKDAHMCVYWSAKSKGVIGLASIGPQHGSRVSPPITNLELNGVTSVMDATPAAIKAWRAQPWN